MLSASREDACEQGTAPAPARGRVAGFGRAYAGLSDAEMMEPGVTGAWSVRDIVAHVATWEEEAVKALPLILAGRRPPRYSVTYGGIDAFNALKTEEKRGLSLAEVLEERDAAHGRLVGFLESAPDDLLSGRRPSGGASAPTPTDTTRSTPPRSGAGAGSARPRVRRRSAGLQPGVRAVGCLRLAHRRRPPERHALVFRPQPHDERRGERHRRREQPHRLRVAEVLAEHRLEVR